VLLGKTSAYNPACLPLSKQVWLWVNRSEGVESILPCGSESVHCVRELVGVG
jgi:hypothetical protein